MGLRAFLRDEEAEARARLVPDIRRTRKRVEEKFSLPFRNPDPSIANRECQGVWTGVHAEFDSRVVRRIFYGILKQVFQDMAEEALVGCGAQPFIAEGDLDPRGRF